MIFLGTKGNQCLRSNDSYRPSSESVGFAECLASVLCRPSLGLIYIEVDLTAAEHSKPFLHRAARTEPRLISYALSTQLVKPKSYRKPVLQLQPRMLPTTHKMTDQPTALHTQEARHYQMQSRCNTRRRAGEILT